MRFAKPLAAASFLALACSFLSVPAHAVTATTTFQVTANVNVACTIEATDLDFGDYTQAQLDAQSEITLNCTPAAEWNVGLNAGTFSGATVTTRKMTGPSTFSLAYGLFSDPARTNNWGDTVGTDTVSGVGTGAAEVLNVYGQIPASQVVGAGGYVDTITATVTF